MQQLARDLKYQLERHHNRKRELRINACLRPDVLTQKIMHALATEIGLVDAAVLANFSTEQPILLLCLTCVESQVL